MNYYQTESFSPQSLDAKVSQVMKGVYVKMFLGLLVTAAVAWFVGLATQGSAFQMYLLTHQWLYWGLAIVEIGLVLWISAGLRKMSSGLATGLFFLFAIVNGLTLSLIFVAYSLAGIAKTFAITAGVFGAMSIYGYYTTKSLAKIGSFLYMALFGLIILCVVNMFMHSSTLEWIVSGIGVLRFIGLTAWDTQQIKPMAYDDPSMANGRLAT
ncbi:MAG: Bax inhibitor-1/YccA family protein, partial [Muribaculaceae bacterium]|nr:Bax inhibitor-1/YccA family protein [Muribaculaceae bacterium]